MSALGAILLGVVLLLLAFLLPLPYVAYVLLLIFGVLSLVYGVYLLFVGGGPRFTVRR